MIREPEYDKARTLTSIIHDSDQVVVRFTTLFENNTYWADYSVPRSWAWHLPIHLDG